MPGMARLRDWPGLHCVRQIVDGEPLVGTWLDRTQRYLARRKGERINHLHYATPETVTFSPLPCWRHLSSEAYRKCVADLATKIEEDAATARKRTGVQPLGAAAILAQDPVSRLKRPKEIAGPILPRGEQGGASSSSMKASRCSSPPIARHPRSCVGEIPRHASPRDASHRRCRSSAGRPRSGVSAYSIWLRLPPPASWTGARKGEVCSVERSDVNFWQASSVNRRSGTIGAPSERLQESLTREERAWKGTFQRERE